jgi:hypothetical protein
MPRKKSRQGSGIGRKHKANAQTGESRPKQNVDKKLRRKTEYNKTAWQVKKTKIEPETHDLGNYSNFENDMRMEEEEFESPTKSALKQEIQKLKEKVEKMSKFKHKFNFQKDVNEKNESKLSKERLQREKEKELHVKEMNRALLEIEERESQIQEVKEHLG